MTVFSPRALFPGVGETPSPFSVSGVPVVRTFATNLALPWHLILAAETGGSITAIRVRSRTHVNGGRWTPWEVIASGLPIAPGASISLVEDITASREIQVEITADGAGTASAWLVGL